MSYTIDYCSNFGRCIYEYNDIVYICLYSLFMNYKLLVITIIDIISLVLQSKSLLMTYNVINYKFIIYNKILILHIVIKYHINYITLLRMHKPYILVTYLNIYKGIYILMY